MNFVLDKLLFYELAAKASMPSVRMHKWKLLLFLHLADDLLRVSVGGSNYFIRLLLWWTNSFMC